MDFENYRYYVCELHTTLWKCKELAKYDDQLQYKSAALFRGVMASKLISIIKSNPQMFDKAALRFKLQLPVKVD